MNRTDLGCEPETERPVVCPACGSHDWDTNGVPLWMHEDCVLSCPDCGEEWYPEPVEVG